MKLLRLALVFALLNPIIHFTDTALSQEATIEIKEIIPNQHISGNVSGLNPNDYPDFKVIIYVHTDQWYIHPYAGQGEDKSWGSIQTNGKWQIQTVQREFKADKVAALLVKRNYPEPTRIGSLEKIQRSAMVIMELRGTQDEGKL